MATPSKHVFIDTEIFDHEQLDFNSPKFQRLKRLSQAGEIEILTTPVTLSEIKAHLHEAATEAIQHIWAINKIKRAVKGVVGSSLLNEMTSLTAQGITEKLKTQLDEYLAASKTQTISIDKVPPSEVFQRYFEGSPPFDHPKKKSEFPDAFVAAGLLMWCDCGNEADRQIYVVSGDPDWKRICADTENLLYLDKLEAFLEKFADAEAVIWLKDYIRDNSSHLENTLQGMVEDGDIFFYVDDGVTDGEIEDMPHVEVAILESNVIGVEGESATIGLSCRISAEFSVSGFDSGSTYRDPDDGVFHSVWRATGNVTQDFFVEATAEITFQTDKPEMTTVNSITFDDHSLCVRVEDEDLSVDYGTRDADDYY